VTSDKKPQESHPLQRTKSQLKASKMKPQPWGKQGLRLVPSLWKCFWRFDVLPAFAVQ
jgi:hypothetical protein